MSSFNPTHTTSKPVEAHAIAAAEFQADGSGKVALAGGVLVEVPAGFASRAVPSKGDVLVRYQDGYLSHCPTDVFHRNARPILDVSAMSFGDALLALKAGARVCRRGWNGKSMWLALSGPLPGREIGAELFWSHHNREYARQNGGSAIVLPCITMRTATGEIQMGWVASQPDMLADDWLVLPTVSDAEAA